MALDQELSGIAGSQELVNRDGSELVARGVTGPVSLAHGLEETRQRTWFIGSGNRSLGGALLAFVVLVVVNLFVHKHKLGVEELWVYLGGSLEALAHNEDFRRNCSRRRWLGRLNLVEKLLKRPQKGVVIGRSEHLGHKGTARLQQVTSQLERVQRQLGLVVGILTPGGTNIGGSVVEYKVAHVALATQFLLDQVATRLSRNIGLDRHNSLDGLDRNEIHTDNLGTARHSLHRDLRPTTRGTA